MASEGRGIAWARGGEQHRQTASAGRKLAAGMPGAAARAAGVQDEHIGNLPGLCAEDPVPPTAGEPYEGGPYSCHSGMYRGAVALRERFGALLLAAAAQGVAVGRRQPLAGAKFWLLRLLCVPPLWRGAKGSAVVSRHPWLTFGCLPPRTPTSTPHHPWLPPNPRLPSHVGGAFPGGGCVQHSGLHAQGAWGGGQPAVLRV